MRTSKGVRVGFLAGFGSLCALGIVGGCSSDTTDSSCEDLVHSATDKDADFEKYKTFAVFEIGSGPGAPGGAGGGSNVPSDLPDDTVANIETANDEAVVQLKALGLKEVDSDANPDLWIVSAAATQEKNGTYWECVPGWYWWGWYYYWDPCAWLAPIPIEYTQGTLLIAVVDAKEQTPVFGGVIQGILECTDDSLIDDRIEAGVAEIFEDYPTN